MTMPRRASLGDRERAPLDELARWLRERFGKRLLECKLFGSRARGEGSEESDLDVLVVVDALTSQEGREIAHRCGDLLTEHDVLVSPFAVPAEHMAHLRRRERLVARDIDRDGIPL